MSTENVSQNTNSVSLRVEAQPATWNSLTEQQQEALDKLLGLLVRAVDKLPRANTNCENNNDPAWLMNESHSQLSFINGKRGSGKTTLMLTLTKALVNGNIQSVTQQGNVERYLRVNQHAKSLQNRVIVVEPIDMEPLPADAPILAAILARVKQAVQSKCGPRGKTKRNILDDDFDDNRETIQFQQIMSRVARSIDSNLQQRRGSLDREQYGQNVQEQEDDRGYLRSDLNEVFKHLSQQLGEADGHRSGGHLPYLFLVPFDDVDLNPERCLELFRIIRTYAPPQLFFLPMGQFELVQRIFQIATAREFEKVANARERFLRLDADEMSGKLAEIAYANLRKMIPEGMRLDLQPFLISSVLKFRPLGAADGEPTLGDLLGDISFQGTTLKRVLQNDWDDSGVSGVAEIEDAKDFRFGQYPGLGAFEVSARRLVDLWDMLRAKRPANSAGSDPSGNCREQLLALEQFLKGVIEEDPDLRAIEKDRILSIGPDAVEVVPFNRLKQVELTSEIQLQIEPYRVKQQDDEAEVGEIEHTPVLQVVNSMVAGGGVPLFGLLGQSRDQPSNTSKQIASREIHALRTRCALVLWHDLRQIGSDNHKETSNIENSLTSVPPVAMKWSDRTIVSWQMPPIATFFQLVVWYNCIRDRLPPKREFSGPLDRWAIESLYREWAWLGEKFAKADASRLVTEVKWSECSEQTINHLIPKSKMSAREKEWLIRLMINGMPEAIGVVLDNGSAKKPVVLGSNGDALVLKFVKENKSSLQEIRTRQLRNFTSKLGQLRERLNRSVQDSILPIVIATSKTLSTRNQFRILENKVENLRDTFANRLEQTEMQLQNVMELALLRDLIREFGRYVDSDDPVDESKFHQTQYIRNRLHNNKTLLPIQKLDYLTSAFRMLSTLIQLSPNEATALALDLAAYVKAATNEFENDDLLDQLWRLPFSAANELARDNNARSKIVTTCIEIAELLVKKDQESETYKQYVKLSRGLTPSSGKSSAQNKGHGQSKVSHTKMPKSKKLATNKKRATPKKRATKKAPKKK